MIVTPASPPDPQPDPQPILQNQNQARTSAPACTEPTPNIIKPERNGERTEENLERLEWSTPRTTKAARRTRLLQWLPSGMLNKNVLQQDTEYNAPSKERDGMLAAGATTGIAASSSRFNGSGFKDRFNNLIPAHRTYFGRSRRTFLLGIAALFLCLLALILGLAIGLSKKHSYVVVSFFPSFIY